MYTNRPQRCTNSQQPKFKLPPFQEDNRLAFVDGVCATLMTSRFGWYEAATTRRQNHLVGFSTGRVLPGQNRVAVAFGQVMLISGRGVSFTSLGRDGPTLDPPAHAGDSPSARGSPKILGRSSSRLPLRT